MSEALRLQAFLRAVAAPGRDVAPVPPFTAYVDPDDPMRFLNYAIPDDGAEPDVEAVERLRAHFRGLDRLPRLEWVAEAAPAVAAVLAAAGMQEELQTPLMACAPEALVAAEAAVDGLAVAPVETADLRDMRDLQRAAFGEPLLAADAEVPDPRRRGGGAVLARVAGEPVSVAQWTRIVDGTTEIAGVATAEGWRRRGLAGALTAAAARAAFDAGARLCILSPGGDEAQRVYARAGFAGVATMLHWNDLAPDVTASG
jgi:ribosomal protein S18 acetylase RimI-like enzyme